MACKEGYIISGGKEGKSRLNVLSEALYPYTSSLLASQGVVSGMSFLDLGCGGGNVSLLAAQMVGNTGTVHGIDFDEAIIALARQDAAAAGAANVTFTAMSATGINYHNEYDIVYSRFLLSHLTDPLSVLQKMAAAVKPGGKVIVEDTHFSGHFCYPACAAFDKYVQYYTTSSIRNGHDPEIGPSLFSLFHRAGLGNIGFDVILPAFSTGPGKWMAVYTLDKIRDTLIAQGIADAESIARQLHELEAFTKDEQTIMSLPHIFRVWGTKE